MSSGSVVSDKERAAAEMAWIQARRLKAGVPIDAPRIGLALSGGGIRSAFVARGFTERLAERNKFRQFDYLSSVSGGSYTALSIFERLANGGTLPLGSDVHKTRPNISLYGLLAPFSDFLLNFVPVFIFIVMAEFALVGNFGKEGWVYTAIATSLIWVIAFVASLIIREERFRFWYEPLTTAVLAILVAILASLSGMKMTAVAVVIIMIIMHNFTVIYAHRIVDKPLEELRVAWIIMLSALCSLSAQAIQPHMQSRNIAVPATFLGLLVLAWVVLIFFSSPTAANQRNWLYRSYRKNLVGRFLPGLVSTMQKQGVLANYAAPIYQAITPLPIINATVTNGIVRSVFELTPLYAGSTFTSFRPTVKWLPMLTLGDAMAISGSALDALGKPRGLTSLFGLFTTGTGYWIDSMPDSPQGKTSTTYVSHWAMALGLEAKRILRLSDGGFAENLGVLSLVQRRADIIICLDSGFDSNYQFDDLSKLCTQLRLKAKATLRMHNIGTVPTEFRMRANESNIVKGSIEYAENDFGKEGIGRYYHVKINSMPMISPGNYADFPHFPTSDQGLTDKQIDELYELGTLLADEVADLL